MGHGAGELDAGDFRSPIALADPPEGEVLLLDLVARLRLRLPDGAEAPAVALVHLEVESREAVRTFRRRLYDYYQTLRRKHDCPVLSIAVYLRVGLDGIGVEEYTEVYGGLEVLRFRYLYVGCRRWTPSNTWPGRAGWAWPWRH